MGNVNIRIDDELKNEVEKIFSELGLTISSATNVFFRQVVRYGGIPFDLRVNDPFYSDENQNHLKKVIEDYESGKSKVIIKTMAELEAMENE